MIKKNLTIVIPCKNEENYISKTLEGVNNQFGIFGTTVIIADGGSTDKTLRIIKDLQKKLKIDIQVIEGGSVSRGRNAGAKIAKTKYILFLDADTTLINKYTINDALIAIKENLLVTCKIKCTSSDTRADIIFWIFNHIQRWMPETFSTGTFMMIRKSTFNALGGFDETIHQSEDYLLSRKIKKSKFKIIKRVIGQDNRRFKKTGYIGMLKIVLSNWIHRKDEDHFRKNVNYWK